MRKVAPDAQIAAVAHQWGDYYTRRAQTVLDNEGREMITKGQTLTDEQILKMNWLVQGVQGKLP